MDRLLLITGPPGAGKSTVARELADRVEPSVLVHGDAFYGFLARGAIPPWLPESQAQNEATTRASARAAAEFLASGYHTVFDGMVGPWFLPTFVAGAGLTEVDYVVLLPDADTCVERVLHRTDHGFRDVDATRKMHAEFAGAPLDDGHVLGSDRPAPELAEVILARAADGALRWELPDPAA